MELLSWRVTHSNSGRDTDIMVRYEYLSELSYFID